MSVLGEAIIFSRTISALRIAIDAHGDGSLHHWIAINLENIALPHPKEIILKKQIMKDRDFDLVDIFDLRSTILCDLTNRRSRSLHH